MHAVYNMLIPQRGRGFTKTRIQPHREWCLISARDKREGKIYAVTRHSGTRVCSESRTCIATSFVFRRNLTPLAVEGSTNRNTKGSYALRDVAGGSVTVLSVNISKDKIIPRI